MPFRQSCGDRNRTCVRAVNPDFSRDSYQHELHRNAFGVVRFELTISCFQGRRIPRLSYTPLKAPSGS